VSDEPPDYFDTLFEADSLSGRVALLRGLVKAAAEKDPAAVQLLLGMLPAIDALLADVQSALASRN
jgi:hypothetical protein